jgi:hypothetical protein
MLAWQRCYVRLYHRLVGVVLANYLHPECNRQRVVSTYQGVLQYHEGLESPQHLLLSRWD